MDFSKKKKTRKDLRLEGYDYSRPGFYFVTICTQDKIEWFGKVVDEKMVLNNNGLICQTCWFDLPNHYKNVKCDAFIVMPNHIHAIIQIIRRDEDYHAKRHGLPEIVRGFKSFTSKNVNQTLSKFEKFFWQRSFLMKY